MFFLFLGALPAPFHTSLKLRERVKQLLFIGLHDYDDDDDDDDQRKRGREESTRQERQ